MNPTVLSRSRGAFLGLALGDAYGASRGRLGTGTIEVGVATQLACFAAEGLIRASVRVNHKGICHPPSVVQGAFHRWARAQGLAGGGPEASGWLEHVPALGERRGNAPATVTALRSGRQGSTGEPATESAGWHALVRGLPLGIGSVDLARDVAALTHGPLSWGPALAGSRLVRACLDASSVSEAALAVDGEAALLVHAAVAAASVTAGDPTVVRASAPDATCASVLWGGVYCWASHPRDPYRALHLAMAAGAPHGVAAVTGSLLGALGGFELLPVADVSRLELAWVVDTLARDLLEEFTVSPGGGEHVEATDPHWWDRYPGS